MANQPSDQFEQQQQQGGIPAQDTKQTGTPKQEQQQQGMTPIFRDFASI